MNAGNKAVPQAVWPAVGLTVLSALVRRTAINLLHFIRALARTPRAQGPRWGIGAAVAVALTVAAIIASMFFLDTVAIEGARRLPRWLVEEADEITNFGLSGYFLYPLGLLLIGLAALLAPSLPRAVEGTLLALAARFGFLFVAIGLPGLFSTIIKRLIGRARPYVGSYDDPFAYMPFIWRPEYASMPSGHATTATAVAIAIGAIYPRLRVVVWIYAAVIMATRVIIAVHHPSDVIAGALVGIVGALLVRRWFAARGLVFRARDLRPYPWPSFKRVKNAVRFFATKGSRLWAS